MPKPTLIYFATRGRAEVIRLLLAETSVDYHEHRVGHGTPPLDGRPTDFAALRDAGDLPFGGVPVWEEPSGFRLSQSAAIANYIARAHKLRGETALEEAQCDELFGAFEDVRVELRKVNTVAPEQRAALRKELATVTLPRWFGYFERQLLKNDRGAGYFVGASLTVADLAIWYLFELIRDNKLGADLEEHPALLAFSERIASRPRIAAYLNAPTRAGFVPLPS